MNDRLLQRAVAMFNIENALEATQIVDELFAVAGIEDAIPDAEEKFDELIESADISVIESRFVATYANSRLVPSLHKEFSKYDDYKLIVDEAKKIEKIKNAPDQYYVSRYILRAGKIQEFEGTESQHADEIEALFCTLLYKRENYVTAASPPQGLIDYMLGEGKVSLPDFVDHIIWRMFSTKGSFEDYIVKIMPSNVKELSEKVDRYYTGEQEPKPEVEPKEEKKESDNTANRVSDKTAVRESKSKRRINFKPGIMTIISIIVTVANSALVTFKNATAFPEMGWFGQGLTYVLIALAIGLSIAAVVFSLLKKRITAMLCLAVSLVLTVYLFTTIVYIAVLSAVPPSVRRLLNDL